MIDIGCIKGELGEKQVAVLGLGASGLSVCRALDRADIPYVCWDDGQTPLADKPLTRFFDTADSNPYNIGLIIQAPGIPLTHPAPHPADIWAKKHGIPIIGDIELFWRAAKPRKTIAITGTNGKSTTTALIGHIVQSSGVKVDVGGNLGKPVLDFEADCDAYVIETSSYQLDLLDQARFDIALLLNFSPDHLSRHGDMDGYIKAKKRIFKNCATAIIGQDDEWSRALTGTIKTPAPIRISQDRIPAQLQDILRDHMALVGKHNAQNAVAAFEACKALDLNEKDILDGIQSFKGLAHRQECVHVENDIRFVNDSKATNADATAKALESYHSIYWIVGGQAKETGLSGLENFAAKIRHAYLIGEAAARFESWMIEHNIPFAQCGTLDKAVVNAWRDAAHEKHPASVILLSPACASWDQYKSFEHRGRHFAEIVDRLFSSSADKQGGRKA